MNFTSSTADAQVNDRDPSKWSAPTTMQGHEFGSEDEATRWCGLNELLFAIEMDEIMELPPEAFL
jgi:hypothetical protein